MTTPPGRGPERQEGSVRATPVDATASPSTTASTHPAGLDSAIELVRAAYVQAMREHGLPPGTRMEISARAELLITEALDGGDEDLGDGNTTG